MPHYNLPHNHGQNIERVLDNMPSAEGFQDISFLFQQLGDSTRLRILWLLCHCEECVNDLAKTLSLTNSAISHQLHALRITKLVRSRKARKRVFYSLQDEHIQWILEETYAHISER